MSQADEAPPAASAEDLPFRQMAQKLPTPCWISDSEGLILWANDAWIAYTGMTPADIAQRGLKGLHDPQVYPEVARVWAQTRQAGAAAEMVFPLKGVDGRFRPFHTRVAPLRDREGRIVRWFGTNTDISVQSDTEARLRTNEEELNELFEQAGDAIFITGPDDRYQQVNPAAAQLLGYSREELLTLSVADLIDPAELARAQKVRTLGREHAIRGEWRLRRKDGDWVDVEVNARVLSDGRRLGIVRDISERVKKARALEAERQSLARQVDEEIARAEAAERHRRHFWDASPDLLAVFAPTSNMPVMINGECWERTLGYNPATLAQFDIMELVHPDDREATRALVSRLAADGAIQGFENRYRAADGRWVWLSWNVVRDGDVTLCIGRDVSEERLRAQYAERAQRLEALGKLTGGVAHDFNNLLTTILGALDLMQRRPEDRELRERLATAALAAVRRGERLTKQLLSFARREPSGAGASDIRRLLGDMKPLLESALREDIALRYELDPTVCGCAIDAAQFEAAVLNLVVNARDAMPEPGLVTLRTRRPTAGELSLCGLAGDFAVVEVLDTGQGMSADVQAHAFEPFFTTKEVGKGSGLGLAQVYGAARQAGGVAILDSDPGAGTAVRMYLKTAELDRAARASAMQDEPQPDRILLVEDDVLVGVVTESILEEDGYEVTRAGDAAEALAALRDGEFGILITDVRMPGAMNGVQLASAAVSRQPSLKILLCSGWTAESLAGELSEARWPLLAKPFDRQQLRHAIAELRHPRPAAAG
jgi:PAS domain S-box-containing protein